MMSINVNAIQLTIKNLQKTQKKVIEKGDSAVRAKTWALWKELLAVSPQFSGDFVSNWFLSVDGNLGAYKMYQGKASMDAEMQDKGGRISYRSVARQMGDPGAIASVKMSGLSRLNGITMKSRIRFINLTDLYSTGKEMVSPRDREQLRPENVIPGGVRIESHLRALNKILNNLPLKDPTK